MMKAVAKGSLLAAFGHVPGGADVYRRLTRELGGTQATHVDKLSRVWPGYAAVWNRRCGLALDGLDLWVHDGGYTPFPHLAGYLLTGRGTVVTHVEGRPLDRYLHRAIEGALATFGDAPAPRFERVASLRALSDVMAAVDSVGGAVVECEHDHARLPLASSSIDLCHSGGALEHLTVPTLDRFLAECYRVLRPGGVASHVFDHRDHLHHADCRWPFLGHLALPDKAYSLWSGHSLGFHSRLSPAEVCAHFDAAGFERVTVRRLTLPQRRYVDERGDVLEGDPGVPRWMLAQRFRDLDELDLRTAAAHYLYRKPFASATDESMNSCSFNG